MTTTDEILEKNKGVINDIFIGINSGEWYNGMSHQVYLDLDDGEIMIRTFASENSWLQRDDGSLVKLLEVSGYTDILEDERYDPKTCDKYDFGWIDFENDLYNRIDGAFNQQT